MDSKEARKKFLFIDDQYVVKVDNLERRTNSAIKHPEPIMKMDAPWDTERDKFGGLNVVFDPQDKLFKMWYAVANRQVDWGGMVRIAAYATSTDGIHWEKPILNMVDHNGSKENNYFTSSDLEEFNLSVTLDPSDPDSRRFKMICNCTSVWGSGCVTDWAKFHSPLSLAYSEDGINWDRPMNINPVIRGISDDVFMFFYDVDRRKYQIFARRIPNLPRDISLYESFDLVNWEDCGRVLVAGDEKDPPTLYNIHGMSVLQYDTYKLGLANTMYLHPLSEGLGVFQTPPDNYPYKNEIGLLDMQLAFSTDGRNWQRADDRSPVVPIGPADAPDSGMVFPQTNSPLVVDGETYIYYSAYRSRHTAWSQKKSDENVNYDLRKTSCGMLAVMPEDHWVSFDAGSKEGTLLAGPWNFMPQQMYINADAEGGSIEIEFVDAYERPIPGLTRADCIGIKANGKDQRVKWKGGISPNKVESDYPGGTMTRIYMKNAKLYSCTFTLPDPDGIARRYWANSNWNKNLFHRNDQWGKDNNLPASGLAPVERGMTNY
jgi:hypothetical protein